jgi:predicted RNA binding protein YcfA (HicA-like mRNA interferase family)
MQRREGDTTLTVIVPMHRELRTGTLLSIVRQSKLDRALFES